MKFIVVPILILLIATQTFSKWIVLIEYSTSKDYIAKVLCENKAKPQLKCGGNCVLMKKMAEDEKQNSSTDQTDLAKFKFVDVLFAFEPPEVLIQLGASLQNPYSARNKTWVLFNPVCAVFHPPLVLR